MQYRKLPVTIDAIQFTGESIDVYKWMKSFDNVPPVQCYENHVVIKTLEGDHRADRADWIIRGVEGEFYPCKPDIFAKTYEEAD